MMYPNKRGVVESSAVITSLTFIVDGIDDMHRTGKKAVRLLLQAEADAAF